MHINTSQTETAPYPTDGEKKTRRAGAHSGEAVSKPPVEEMLRDKGDEGEPHGGGQHVEDACHVIHIQLTRHHLVLLIVANSCQPLGF